MDALPPRIGRYEIKRLIGRGGMGALYLANDPNTNRLVAIKLLDAPLESEEFRLRFVREVRALAALNHPNIVSAYDTGEHEGAPYIVMEFVDGETLSALIRQRAAMNVPQKLKLMTELCAGLRQAHAAGIIHRDIKPANLMVDRQGRLKILDFGIARVVERQHDPGEPAADAERDARHARIHVARANRRPRGRSPERHFLRRRGVSRALLVQTWPVQGATRARLDGTGCRDSRRPSRRSCRASIRRSIGSSPAR